MPSRNTAVATAEPVRQEEPNDPVRALVRGVEARKPQLASLLGIELNGPKGPAMLDRFVTVALHAATSDPDLMRATTESLVESIRDAAMYGLEPVGYSGDGAIVVYNEKRRVERAGRTPGSTVIVEETVPVAHFQPMYRGLLKLARRSDQVASIDAHVIYEGDRIELATGSEPYVSHWPELDGRKRGAIIGAYAVATLANGQRYVDPMTFADIEITRKQSRAATASAWTTFWPEMARKTVLRRLMKRLPLDSLAERALRDENEAEDRSVPIVVSNQAPVSEARARLVGRFAAPAIPAASTSVAGGQDSNSAERTDTPSSDSDGSTAVLDRESAEATDEEIDRANRAGLAPGERTVFDDVADAREICGATSDPALGPVETCILEPDHDLAPNGSKAHISDMGTRFPVARKEGTK